MFLYNFFLVLIIFLTTCNKKENSNKSMNSSQLPLLGLDKPINDQEIIENLSNNAKENHIYSNHISYILEMDQCSNKIDLAKENGFLILYNSGKKFNYRYFNNINCSPKIDFNLINAEYAFFNKVNFNNCNLLKHLLLSKNNNKTPFAFSNDGSRLLESRSNSSKSKLPLINKNYNIDLYDLKTEEYIKSFKILKSKTKIKELKFFPLNTKILISYINSNKGGIGIYNLKENKYKEIIQEENKIFKDMKISSDGCLISYIRKNILLNNDISGKYSKEKPNPLQNIYNKSNEIQLYDINKNKFHKLTSPKSFYKYAISPNQQFIVAIGQKNSVVFKNKLNPKFKNGTIKYKNGFSDIPNLPFKILKNIYPDKITKVAFSIDGKNVFIGNKNHRIIKLTFDEDMELIESREILFLQKTYFNSLKDFILSKDGNTLITVSSIINNNTEKYDRIRFWDLDKKVLSNFYQTYFNIDSIHLCSNSDKLLCNLKNNSIIKININQNEHYNLEHFDKPYNSILFFNDQNFLISKSKDNIVYVWNIFTSKLIKKVNDNEDKLERIKPFSTMKKILTNHFENFNNIKEETKDDDIEEENLNNDNNIEEKIDDIQDDKNTFDLKKVKTYKVKEENIKYSDKTPEVLFFKTDSNKYNMSYENSAAYDHTPSFLGKNDIEEYSRIQTNLINISYSNYVNSNEKILIINNESVVILNITDGFEELRYRLNPIPKNDLTKIAISNDLNKIALIYKSEIYVIDANENKQLAYIKKYKNKITNIKFSNNDDILISTSGNNNCRFWDLRSHKCKQYFKSKKYFQNKKKEQGIVNDFYLSKDNNLLITVGFNNSILIRNLKTEEILQNINLVDEIYKIAVSNDNRYIATSGFGMIRIWKTSIENAVINLFLKNNFSFETINIVLEYIDYNNAFKFGIDLMNVIGPKGMYIDNCIFKDCQGIDPITKELLIKRGAKFI